MRPKKVKWETKANKTFSKKSLIQHNKPYLSHGHESSCSWRGLPYFIWFSLNECDKIWYIYSVELETRYNLVCLLSWHTCSNCQWGSVENKTWRRKKWFQLPNCELFIFMYQHSRTASILSTYLPVKTIWCQDLNFLSWFLDRRLLRRNLWNQGF